MLLVGNASINSSTLTRCWGFSTAEINKIGYLFDSVAVLKPTLGLNKNVYLQCKFGCRGGIPWMVCNSIFLKHEIRQVRTYLSKLIPNISNSLNRLDNLILLIEKMLSMVTLFYTIFFPF